MPRLKPQDLEAGMVLADDVSNLDGQILFKKGVELKDRQIEILQMWGVTEVDIAGENLPPDEIEIKDVPPAVLKEAKRIVSERFQLVNSSHPTVLAVKNIAIEKVAIELIKKGDSE